MLALLPLISLLLNGWIARRFVDSRRSAALIAITFISLEISFITEILSLFRFLTAGAITCFWVVDLISKSAYVLRQQRRTDQNGLKIDWLLAVPMMVIAGCSLVVCYVAPPNNYDSMTYHMPRVMHWIQNHGVMHYPTHILRQLYLSPGAEYAILHLQLLAGSDRFANMVQWTAWVLCAIGISRIAGQLGASSGGQWIAALLVLALPIAVLESATTQNDLVLALWLVVFVSAALAWIKKPVLQNVFLMAAAAGLAVLSKGTSYVLLAPLTLFMLTVALKRKMAIGQCAVVVAAIIFSVLLINAGVYIRNLQTFGSPLGINREPAVGRVNEMIYANSRFAPARLASNLVRNIALDVALPSEMWNTSVVSMVTQFDRAIGVDVNDADTTWPGEHFRLSADLWRSEIHAGSAIHFGLFVAAVITLLIKRSPQRATVGGFVVACAACYLTIAIAFRWQPWNTRLHLPIAVLLCAAIATVIDLNWNRALSRTLASLIILAAFPFAIQSHFRPMTGRASIFGMDRTQQYFMTFINLDAPVHRMAQIILQSGTRDVGLQFGPDDMEYPLWAILQDAGWTGRIEHINSTNVTKSLEYPDGEFQPKIVITIDSANNQLSIVRAPAIANQ